MIYIVFLIDGFICVIRLSLSMTCMNFAMASNVVSVDLVTGRLYQIALNRSKCIFGNRKLRPCSILNDKITFGEMMSKKHSIDILIFK